MRRKAVSVPFNKGQREIKSQSTKTKTIVEKKHQSFDFSLSLSHQIKDLGLI